MNVKTKIALFVFALFGFMALLSAGIFITFQYKVKVKENISSLDSLQYLSVDGTLQGITSSPHSKVIFFFNPDCDHCQAEARLISANASRLANAGIYFLSVEEFEGIKRFANEFGLTNHPDLGVGQVDKQVIYKMGVNTIPMCFIYSPEGKLVEKYVGEVSIEAIVKHLQ